MLSSLEKNVQWEREKYQKKNPIYDQMSEFTLDFELFLHQLKLMNAALKFIVTRNERNE